MNDILEILESHAVDGKFRFAPKGVTMDDLAELGQAGLLDRKMVDGGYEYTLLSRAKLDAVPEPQVVEARAKTTPKPKVLYREPVDQAEHRRAVRSILRGGGITRAVALEAHDQIGMTYAEFKHTIPFGQIKRDLSPGYLVGSTGFGMTAVKKAMKEAVEAGLYVRIDNGKGGKHDTNPAVYMAVVPQYWV